MRLVSSLVGSPLQKELFKWVQALGAISGVSWQLNVGRHILCPRLSQVLFGNSFGRGSVVKGCRFHTSLLAILTIVCW